ncbi:MAG: aldehyde dehydrogenase family protein, partial [Comamonadaceae bacterium]
MDTPSKTGNAAAQLARPTLWREQCYVNGKWIGGAETIEVNNPSSGEIIARVPKFGRKETEDAINAANAALPEWRARTGKNRAAILRKWSDLMLAHTVDLGRIITLEQGKPKAEAEGEIAYAASFLEWFAEEARRVDGEVLQSPNAAHQMLAVKEAIGVCAAITPWNFPAAMITRKVGPALRVI